MIVPVIAISNLVLTQQIYSEERNGAHAHYREPVPLKDGIAKNFVASEHHSFTFAFTFIVVVVDLLTNCILSFLFPAETDVLVPVFSQSTDVVVVNFVMVPKFPTFASL